MKKTVLIIILFALGFTINAQVTYVNINATGANNGTSWADAYTDLHSATYNTTSGEIWVAAGTYVPTRSFTGNIPANNRQKTFRVQNNVQVYGGFNGTETLLSERNWATNVTTLSANVGGGLFAYNIVRFDANNNTTVLDGFTVSQGQAGGTGTVETYGGAIHLTTNASPTVRNCKFLNNTANQSGGAISATGGSLQIFNCEFKNNGTSVYDGAAIYLTGVSSVNIGNCLFANNYAARHGGAILAINSTNVKIYNSTFVSNTSGAGGSGNAIQISNTTTTSATVKNCIFYNNSPNAYDVTYNSTATLSILNCLGTTLFGTTMSNNVSGNPQFTDFNTGDYTLLCTSPAVNTGDASGLTIPLTDLNGNPRTTSTIIDMGAYENQTTNIAVSANKTSICAGDYVFLRGSCDPTGYTWSNGVTNNVAFYPTTTQTYTCTGISTGSVAQITVEVISVNNETITAPSSVCLGSSATITTSSSVNGVDYFLRDNVTDNIVDGPILGTGSSLSFNTNALSSTTTYNVIGAVNPTIVSGVSGALDFDGIDDQVRTTFFMPTTTQFTIEANLYPRSINYDRVISSYSSAVAGEIVLDTYSPANNGRSLRLYTAGGTALQVDNVLTLNAWNHIAATFNAGELKLFVNGVQVGALTIGVTSITANSSNVFCFGEDNLVGPAEYLNGKLDEVRFWNTALSSAQITSRMNTCLVGNEANLLAYYNFADGVGSTVVNDASTNSNNGTLSAMDPATDWVTSTVSCSSSIQDPATSLGKALDFDGTNDLVATSFKMPATSLFTIEGWVYPRSVNYDRLFSNYSAAVNGTIIIDTYNATNNGRAVRFNIYGTANALFTVGAPNLLTLNAWNHVACTFNNGVMTVYVNGFEAATGTAPFTSIPQIANNLCFGEDFLPGAAEYLNGKLDEVRIWNKALNQTEITTNMNNCLTGTETDLLAYYNFEDGSGTVVSDLTINANHGLMQNMDAATDWVAGKFSCDPACSLEMTQLVTVNVDVISNAVSTTFNSIVATQAGAAYRWLDCNNGYAVISGETAQSFTPTVNGNYAVEVILNSCTDTSVCVVFNSVSIHELGNASFNVFPNPTSNNLTIKSNEVIEKTEVYNVLGTLVLSETKTSFSVAELPTGIYILQIKTAKGTGTTRFVKE